MSLGPTMIFFSRLFSKMYWLWKDQGIGSYVRNSQARRRSGAFLRLPFLGFQVVSVQPSTTCWKMLHHVLNNDIKHKDDSSILKALSRWKIQNLSQMRRKKNSKSSEVCMFLPPNELEKKSCTTKSLHFLMMN